MTTSLRTNSVGRVLALITTIEVFLPFPEKLIDFTSEK